MSNMIYIIIKDFFDSLTRTMTKCDKIDLPRISNKNIAGGPEIFFSHIDQLIMIS